MGNVRRRNRIGRLLAFLLALALFAAVPGGSPGTVRGAEKRVVRVGFFPMDGYHEIRGDGSLAGMDVEYLEALCDYVSWDVEYVECESWDCALDMLRQEEIDLVGSAQYSRERAETYQYASLASGYTFGAIAVNSDSTLAYEDFNAMSDATLALWAHTYEKTSFMNI